MCVCEWEAAAASASLRFCSFHSCCCCCLRPFLPLLLLHFAVVVVVAIVLQLLFRMCCCFVCIYTRISIVAFVVHNIFAAVRHCSSSFTISKLSPSLSQKANGAACITIDRFVRSLSRSKRRKQSTTKILKQNTNKEFSTNHWKQSSDKYLNGLAADPQQQVAW